MTPQRPGGAGRSGRCVLEGHVVADKDRQRGPGPNRLPAIAGQVVIKVKAFGIDHAEMHMRRGEWAELRR